MRSQIAAASVVAASALLACQRQPERRLEEEAKVDPFTVVAAIDRKNSTYKDPSPPTTSPPPGMNPRNPRPAINPADVQISGRTRSEALGPLFFRVPVEWLVPPSSPGETRAGFILPGPGGEARMEIYRVAAAGTDRRTYIRQWRRDFTAASGAPLPDEEVRVQEMVRGPLAISLVDLAGTYVAPVAPDSGDRRHDPGYRMLTAIVEYEGEYYFFEAVGPAFTMAIWEHAFADFATSFAIEYVP